ncbi:hypothetical protein [Jeotgalibaca caeni]|uniref:hypothetical protein n=1 Tax=Jeotgalibaca caeni TaxID=3028623 RepID=UPI00237E918C|nr:hypothetical protein [Jeotgalibaca caeni]MDE1548132.1 hypothetical protein [Jeotgalibaca caeni]
MKNRTFLILGSLMVAGAVAYGVYKHLQKRNKVLDVTNSTPETIYSNTATPDASATAPEFRFEKEAVVASVQERHNEAVDTIEESLNTIFNGDDVVSENDEILEKIGDGLDDLLK